MHHRYKVFNVCDERLILRLLRRVSIRVHLRIWEKQSHCWGRVWGAAYLGNLFAVLPLVRYYWATFCHSSNLEASLHHLFSPPTLFSLPCNWSHDLCHFFLTFVSILSLCCHVTITPNPQFPEKIWATNQREIWAQINGVRPTGSDRLTSGARAVISETTKRLVSTTNTGLSAGVSLPAK